MGKEAQGGLARPDAIATGEDALVAAASEVWYLS